MGVAEGAGGDGAGWKELSYDGGLQMFGHTWLMPVYLIGAILVGLAIGLVWNWRERRGRNKKRAGNRSHPPRK